MDSCCSCWYWVLGILGLLALLYNISTTCHYYIRISFFYVCILLHGMECNILMIPSWLQGRGADLIFHVFYYWTLWTGVNVEVRDYDKYLEHLEGPAVIVVNHQSALDVISMTRTWPPRGTVMMKKSLMYVPFFNFTSYLGNAVFVDRFNREKALHAVDQCVDQIKEKNLKLWIFPEGTRNRHGGLLPFKKGAFNIAIRAHIPIIPIVLSDYSPFYSKNKKYFMNDGEVIAQVLPPISTDGKTLDDAHDLADEVRSIMLKVYEKISPEAKLKMENKRAAKNKTA